jgi:hypothetical protein
MPLSHEHVGSKIPSKIQIYILTRAELLITLCYEIPCTVEVDTFSESATMHLFCQNGHFCTMKWPFFVLRNGHFTVLKKITYNLSFKNCTFRL